MRSDSQLQSHAEEHDDDFSSSSKKKSIGELTQNLHGGKYQFSDTQYLSGNSIIGQEFAESLYSSSSSGGGSGSCMDNNDEDFIDNEEIPKWAMRLQQRTEHKGRQLTGTLTFTSSNNVHTITIKNEERSWEQYFAYILRSSDNNNSIAATASEDLFQLSSVRGHLAPRGGASNACDASKPYLDSADIRIEFVGDPQAAVKDEELLLVVGTEAEVWRWQLSFA